MNPEKIDEPFYVYINFGLNTPTSGAYDFKGTDTILSDGYQFLFLKPTSNIIKNIATKRLCYDCNLTILIKSAEHSIIKFRMEFYYNIRKIHVN